MQEIIIIIMLHYPIFTDKNDQKEKSILQSLAGVETSLTIGLTLFKMRTYKYS